MIPLIRPNLSDPEIDAVAHVLRSGRLIQATHVMEFENAVAFACERHHAVAVSNGTAALQLALAVLGVGPGDEVLCPDLTWPSPTHAVLLSGATPVLVDIDEHEWNSCAEDYTQGLTSKTKAAIVIDQFGNPARFGEIRDALGDVPIIEDAACAIGSRSNLGPCGKLGVISCMSFHPRKVVTTGEGGMCLTDDPAIASRLQWLRNHGQERPGVFKAPAGNYRLTEMAAAIGQVQMTMLASNIARRQELAKRYHKALPFIQWQKITDHCTSNYQTMGAVLPHGSSANERDAFTASLRACGVESGFLSYANHAIGSVIHGPARTATGSVLPNSRSVVDRGFSVPLFADMRDDEQSHIIESLQRLLEPSQK